MFTSREKEIIGLITQAKSRKIIANDLNISIHTIDAHLRSIYLKTKTHSMMELFVWIIKNQKSHPVPTYK